MQLPPVDRSPVQWRPQGADLYTTGASGAVPVRPVNVANPVESIDRLGEGAIVRDPGKPSAPDEDNRDWTLAEAKKDKPQQIEEQPKEPPLYQMMMDFIQSMWRASTQAVDVAQDVNKMTAQERLAQQAQNDKSLTYADPKIKRTGGL